MTDDCKLLSPHGDNTSSQRISAGGDFSQNSQTFFSDSYNSQDNLNWRALSLPRCAGIQPPAIPTCDGILDLTRSTKPGDVQDCQGGQIITGTGTETTPISAPLSSDRSPESPSNREPVRRSRRRPPPREDDDYYYGRVVGSKRPAAAAVKVEATECPQLVRPRVGQHTRTSAKVHLRQLQQALEEKDVQMCILAARLEASREQTNFLKEMLMRICQTGSCPDPPPVTN
ncbi:Zta [Colobine gammaherpesvirus 1]|uniref:Zta n=1 Tax=Colobine gammaherpesvirus 1 TaxID=2597325 RepID=A0A5B8G8F0_9GAMA|nr:Zta [Colobine gammaherpesvirus 1]QDQ69257.1 Zta [Colobine gammaherpesvirus 1]